MLNIKSSFMLLASIIASLFATLLSGCSSTPKTHTIFIRDTTYTVVPKWIEGQGIAQVVTDTMVQYVKTKENDTIIKIRYRPGINTVEYVAKPEVIHLKVRDTLYNTKTVIKTNSFFENIGIFAIGSIVMFIGLYILAKVKK